MNSVQSTARPLFAVGVCYHLEPRDFISRMERLALRCGRKLLGVTVSNNEAHELNSPVLGMDVVRGTNAHLDFSGYFEGLQRLTVTHPDVVSRNVLFINDSLFAKHASATILRRVLSLDALVDQLAVPAIAGKVDPYRSICARNPWSGDAGYISSFCFLLNRLAQPVLRQLLADAEGDGVLSASPVGSATWGVGLSGVMREFLRAHSIYPGSPYLWRPSEPVSIELRMKKVRCVYFEQRLSGAIGTTGGLVPVNSGPRSRIDIATHELCARVARALRPI